MSGHSKWSSIKHKKGATDKKRGQLFSKLARAIIVAAREGGITTAMAGAAQVLEALYEFPYLAHAALEPMNAVARMGEDGVLEVWGGHQAPDLYQYVASQVAGGSSRIFGVMIESHLVEGRQTYVPGASSVYGQSITDACLSLEQTEPLLESFARAVRG